MTYGRTRVRPPFAYDSLEPRRLMSATGPSPAAQYMLELVNRARANPVAVAAADGIALDEGLPAGTISPDAKQPLAFDPNLIAAATSHTAWMLRTGTFAHDEGSTDPGAQMGGAGYSFTGSWTWGQNIAWSGTSPAVPPVNATTAALEQNLFVDAGEPGRGHRVNLMNPRFQAIGIGIATGAFQGFNAVLATQDFAASGSGAPGGAFLTGVAYADANGNGAYDAGEGLGNITVTATRVSDGAEVPTTTWSAGGYTLPLVAGTYNVSASGTGLGNVAFGRVTIGSDNVEADFTPGHSSTPAPSDPVPTPAPAPVTSPVSSAAAAGWVTGMLFSDRNGNGIHDRGEGVLGGWRVYADLNGDGLWERGEPFAIANAHGAYRLKLAAGSYAIREARRGYWAPSTPASGEWDATLVEGQTITDNFANVFAPPRKLRG